MNALSRFDPFRDFWPEAFGRFPSAALRVPEGMPAEIRLDVSETASAYEVRAEIPGARKEDIHVRVDGNRVVVRDRNGTLSDDAKERVRSLRTGHGSLR